MRLYTIDEIERMRIADQIEAIEAWLRDHPTAHPHAIHEMRLRLSEQHSLLTDKTKHHADNSTKNSR